MDVEIPLAKLIAALEGQAANTDTDPRWVAAQELKKLIGWEGRTIKVKV